MSVSDSTIVATTDAGVLTMAARPWAPFVVGFAVGLGISLWALYDGSWKMRHNVQNPWEYDSEYAKAWASFKRMNWRWSVLLGGPFVLGFALWLVWLILTLAAGV
mgnify:FL=1